MAVPLGGLGSSPHLSSQCHVPPLDLVGWQLRGLLTLTPEGNSPLRNWILHPWMKSLDMSNVCSVLSNGVPHSFQLLKHLAKCSCGLLVSCLGGVALPQGQLLLHHSSQQF